MESIIVECYAGSKADEYPLRFYIGRRKVEIITIEKRWLTPEYRCFKILGDDDCNYVLEYNFDLDTWSLLTINKQ